MEIFEGKNIEQKDLEFVDFEDNQFIKCTFSKCVVKDKKICGSKFKNCSFYDCQFINCNFNSAMFQGVGVWKGCLFESSDLSKVIIGSIRLEASSFLRNRIKETTFDGTSFKKIVFEGEILSAWFYGIPYSANLYKRDFLFKKQPKDLTTPVIDFTDSLFKDVTFSRGIDLSRVIFPKQENFLIIKDPKRFFESFLSESERIFSDIESLTFCKRLVDSLFFKPDNHMMPLVTVNLGIFYPSLNAERDGKIVEILRKLAV
ncbi:pentapeptide repeat-containing protein [Sphingobacterium sp. LRF_L2]|uniref:pentapeptide repeat-containing protein n=1 Tax=Sphingobacterium sp. LRF_L2 TaxID=3369421 RepID=UPI003F5E39AA